MTWLHWMLLIGAVSICGLTALNWFHRERAGRNHTYAKTWHIYADYILVALLGPISLLINSGIKGKF